MRNKIKSYWTQFRAALIWSPMRRVDYLRKRNVFGSIGDRVMITSRKLPLYPKLIKIGSNVWIASKVTFVTHDVIHYLLNGLNRGKKYFEKIGCIQIGDDVFIGAGTTVMYNVKIGNQVVVAAGSVIVKDVPSGSVVAGVPAKVIGSFEDLVNKREQYEVEQSANSVLRGHVSGCVTNEEANAYWEQFNADRAN